jgi:site-specific recombinase XerD
MFKGCKRYRATDSRNNSPVLQGCYVMIGLQLETLKNQQEAKELQFETLRNWQEAKEQAEKDLAETKEQAEKTKDQLTKQINQLQLKLNEQTAQLEALVNAQKRKDEAEREQAEKRILRSNRKRKPARDAATTPELLKAWEVIEQIKSDKYPKARHKVVLLMLYISGKRISNLRLLTANHLNQLLDETMQFITLPCIKSKVTKYRNVPISKSVRVYIEYCKEEILALLEGKQGDEFVLTAKGSKEPLNEAYLIQHTNKNTSQSGETSAKKPEKPQLQNRHDNR